MTELMIGRTDGVENSRSFEQEWPEISQRVRNSLAARGASSWVRDDILQETALRLFRMWDRVDAERSPCGLALTIAHNLLWDEQHRRAPGEVLGMVPDIPGDHDVERAGIARAELGRVYRLMPRLKSNHRSVLLAEIGGPEPVTSSSDALKMLRLRARRKLTALMEGASAGILVMGFELRRLSWRAASAVRRHAIPAEFSAGAVVAFCGVVAVLMVPFQQTPAPSAEVGETGNATSAVALLHGGGSEIGPERAVLGLATRSGDASRTPRTRDPKPAGDRYHFHVGEEGPVNGEAGVQLLPRDDDEVLTPPGCRASQPRDTEISVSCVAHTPDRELKIRGRVAAKP